MRPVRGLIATLLIALATMAGATTAHAVTNANLWVDTNGGSCTRQSTAGAYVDAQGCSSFSAAATASTGGDVIGVCGGAGATCVSGVTGYPFSALSLSTSLTRSPRIVFKPATGANVVASGSGEMGLHNINGVTIDGSDGLNGKGFELKDKSDTGGGFMSIGYAGAVDNLSVIGFRMHDNVQGIGQAVYVSGCENTLMKNIELYNIFRGDGFFVSTVGATTGGAACNNTVFDGLFVHDFVGSCVGSCDHQDGIQLRKGNNYTIRNSRFINLPFTGSQEVFDGRFGDLGGDGNLTFENNVLNHAASSGGSVLNLGGGEGTVIFRNNTISGPLNTCAGGTCLGPSTFRNNIMDASCGGSLSDYHSQATAWSNNVLLANCGWGDAVATGGWAGMFVASSGSTAAIDYRLTSGSFAIDKGSGTDFVSTDLEGFSRPAGAAPDAGAYEFGAAGGSTPIGASDSVTGGDTAVVVPNGIFTSDAAVASEIASTSVFTAAVPRAVTSVTRISAG